MSYLKKTILILVFLLPIVAPLFAQESTTTTATAATSTTTTSTDVTPAEGVDVPEPDSDSMRVRESFSAVIRRAPPELSTILVLDPTLLSDPAFLGRYPELAKFVESHPEVRHHPRFYLADFRIQERNSMVDDVLNGLFILLVMASIATAFAWLLKMVIDHQRWKRLSRVQTEVHNKILDRFGSTNELLEYMKTPAGSKFLESAPIPLHAEAAPQSASTTRVIWSVQIGVIVAAAASGLMIVSTRFADEAGKDLFAMGVIALSIGLGFIASAFISMSLTRRLNSNPGEAES